MISDLFVTGADTNVGKTVLSALIVAASDRGYWKPIQTGALEDSDRGTVVKLAGIPETRAYPEAFIFDPPVSPHLAAEWKGVRIDLSEIRRPMNAGPLVIEGAGGVLVPINEGQFMIDLITKFGAPVVIAARSTLGTINHTLLTIFALRDAGADVRGVVMIGAENSDNRNAIERYGRVAVVGSIPLLASMDRSILRSVFDQRFDKASFL